MITSVLESLRKNLPDFTLDTVVRVVLRSMRTGRSLFAEQLKKHRQALQVAFSPG